MGIPHYSKCFVSYLTDSFAGESQHRRDLRQGMRSVALQAIVQDDDDLLPLGKQRKARGQHVKALVLLRFFVGQLFVYQDRLAYRQRLIP